MSAKLIFNFGLKVRNALLTKWWRFSGPILLKLHGVDFKKSPILYGYPIVSMSAMSSIILGEGVVLCSDARFTALGVARPVILRTLRPHARIAIGADTGMSGVVICAAVSIEIGKDCLLGADVQIYDNDFHKLAPDNRRHDDNPASIGSAPVIIEDNVFIGAGSKILKGVIIGRNSVIGAGSVVSKDIPANSIAAGNPAKFIAELPITPGNA